MTACISDPRTYDTKAEKLGLAVIFYVDDLNLGTMSLGNKY